MVHMVSVCWCYLWCGDGVCVCMHAVGEQGTRSVTELLVPKKVWPLSGGTSECHHSSGPHAPIKLVCGFVNTFVLRALHS